MRTSLRTVLFARSAAAGVAGVVVAVAGAAAQPPSFTLMGIAAGNSFSYAYGVSADGRIVTGYSGNFSNTPMPAFVWSEATGRYDFGLESGLPPATVGRALSGDGSFVVGHAVTSAGPNGTTRAFRWQAGAGGGPGTYQDLGLFALYARSYATGVSGDGSVVVGRVEGVSSQAFRWTEAGGMQGLGFLPGHVSSQATAISRNGTTIAGWGYNGAGTPRAFTWTAGGGLRPLGVPPGTDLTAAYGVNFDGSIVVGRSGLSQPTIWRDGVPQVLGVATGFVNGWGLAVSDDGNVIGGRTSNSPNLVRAGVWTASGGAQVLSDYLAANGVSIPAGWILEECNGVSADGLTFSGIARLPGQSVQGFVAHVPGPGGVVGVVAGLAVLGRRRRRDD